MLNKVLYNNDYKPQVVEFPQNSFNIHILIQLSFMYNKEPLASTCCL